MKSDDPEQRIRELERELADATAGARRPRYAPAASMPPPLNSQRNPSSLLWVAGVLAVIAVLIGAAIFMVQYLRSAGGGGSGPITMAQGGTLDLVGNGQNQTIVCNDSSLTLSANNSTIHTVGHCASLKVTGFDDHINVDSADSIEVTGFGNTITDPACGNGKLTLAGYNNSLTVGGHCGSLTVSAYDNLVRVDSADTINVAGYNNTVTYHSGSPKITQSGSGIAVTRG